MQVSTEKKEGLKHLITVTVPAEDVKKAYNTNFTKYAKNAKIDGFRKGHIPTKVLEQQFGGRIYEDAYDELVRTTIGAAIKESKLDVVGFPQVEVKTANFNTDSEFVYAATVEVAPVLEIKPLEELKLKKVVSEISDSDLDNMIEVLRKQQGKWQVEDNATVEEGKRANINFIGRTGGVEFEGGKAENFNLDIGTTQMIPGFTEQIVGHKAGETFTIQVKFPEDYHAENLKGKDAEFDITVNSVSTLVLPELNEDFFKLFNLKENNIETLKVELRKNMERELRQAVYMRNSTNLFEALGKQYGEFDIPQAYVDNEIERLAEGYKQQMKQYGIKKLPDTFDPAKMFADQAKNSARLGVIVRALIKEFGINEASDSYVQAELNSMASAYEDSEETIKEIKNDKKFFAMIQNRAIEVELVDKAFEKAADGTEQKTFHDLLGR